MSGVDVHHIHHCPRCGLSFAYTAELDDHLDRDHDVVLARKWKPAAETAHYPEAPELWGTLAVAVDPSRPPTSAVRVSSAVAKQASLGIDLVAAAMPGLPPGSTDAYLTSQADEAAGAGAEVVARHNLGSTSPADAVVAHARSSDATLLGMATRSRGPLGQLVLGSVAVEVLQSSTVPVLAVGPHVEPRDEGYGPFVVGLDGSELAEAALGAAASLADAMGAALVLVEAVDADEAAAADYLRTVASTLAAPPAAMQTIRGHDPAKAVVELADGIDGAIIALGTHGRTRLRRLTMGSVAMDVIRQASSPVLLVPPNAVGAALVSRSA